MKLSATAVLLAVFSGAAGLWAYGHYEQMVGRRDARIAALEHQADSLRHRAARVDTIYRLLVDTLQLVRWRTDSLLRRDTLHFTDTLIHVDTVRQIVERERLACDAVVLSCEARVAARDSIIRVQTEELRLMHRQGRFLGIPLPSRGIVFGVGVAAGWLLRR